jgi:hypothetical protein
MGSQALSGIFKNATLVFAKPKAVGQ